LCITLIMTLIICTACTVPAVTEESPQGSASAPVSQTSEAVVDAPDELELALREAATIDEIGDIMKP
jgi:hypothetical protein